MDGLKMKKQCVGHQKKRIEEVTSHVLCSTLVCLWDESWRMGRKGAHNSGNLQLFSISIYPLNKIWKGEFPPDLYSQSTFTRAHREEIFLLLPFFWHSIAPKIKASPFLLGFWKMVETWPFQRTSNVKPNTLLSLAVEMSICCFAIIDIITLYCLTCY